MPRTVLITGVNGFVGQYVAREARSQGLHVIGTGMSQSLKSDQSSLVDKYIPCDLTDMEAVLSLPLSSIDCVINLAGLANVGASFDDPDIYMKVNGGIADNICRAINQSRPSIRHVYISSGGIYSPYQPLPLTEDSKLAEKCSPYGKSKMAAEATVRDYQKQGQDAIIVRPFNHAGPKQLPGFLIPDLADKIMQVKAGETITVGNLKTKRDYTHVEDVAKAYIALATAESLSQPLYNVCSGKSVSGEDIFTMLVAELRPHDNISFTIDPSKARPDDPQDLYGSYDLLHNDTGWQPTKDIAAIIKDFADWKRQN